MATLCNKGSTNYIKSSNFTPESEHNAVENQSQVQDIDKSEKTVEKQQVLTTSKRSWVWTHFITLASGGHVQCQYANILGQKCGKTLKKDKTGSTKSMQSHLSSVHNLIDPDKGAPNQAWLDSYIKKNLLSAAPRLNSKTLKTALVYLIASADLPFSFCEQPALRDLLKICNPQIEGMLAQRNSITAHATKLYLQHREYLIDKFIKCQDNFSFTTDMWTSPANTSHMSLTAHFINKNFKMISVPIGLIPVDGDHSGANLAEILFKRLQRFEVTDKITAITADNASSNRTMAIAIQELTNGNFQANKSTLGCVAHVINLAAKVSLKKFGGYIPSKEDSEDSDENQEVFHGPAQICVANLVSRPDGESIDVSASLSKISRLAVAINKSSQRKERFLKYIELYENPNTAPVNCKGLICDVQTRWNSTYEMIERAYHLQKSYDQMCSAPEFQKYKLSTAEWDKVGQIIQFLEPLHDATVWLCGSEFPTLSRVIPTYILLMKKIKQMQNQYDSIQLLIPGNALIEKLEHYFFDTIKKPGPICATILDPRLKTNFFTVHTEFLSELGISQHSMRTAFEASVNDFSANAHNTKGPPHQSQNTSSSTPQATKRQKTTPFYKGLYVETRPISTYRDEISQFLAEAVEAEDCDVLTYWKDRQKVFPTLSQMARKYLAIPGTSCPSERVFSLGRKILHYQRTTLTATHVEQLLLLKEWYRLSGPLFLCPE